MAATGRGGDQREGSSSLGEPLADEYGSFLPHKQFSGSAVAQLKRRFSPTPTSSSSATTPPNDPSSHSRSLHKDKSYLPPASRASSSSSNDDVATKPATVAGTAGRSSSSSSPLKLVQEMVSMPFGSPLVSPLRDGPAGASSPVRPSPEELSSFTHSPPTTAADATDGDSPARPSQRQQRRRDGATTHSPTTTTPPSRERSPTGDVLKRKRETSDRRRTTGEAHAASRGGGDDRASEQQQKARGKEPDAKRPKREPPNASEDREVRERRDPEPRPPDLRERAREQQQQQQQRHNKERERARGGSEKGAPSKDESLTLLKDRQRTSTVKTATAGIAPPKTSSSEQQSMRSLKPHQPSSAKDGGGGGGGSAQAPGKPDQRAPGDAHPSSRGGGGGGGGSSLSNGLKSEANTLKRAADKALKTDEAHEALGLYIEAGLKYLQCCHQLEQEAVELNSPLRNAAHMYKRTAKFFDDILKIATPDKDKLRTSACHRCVGVALARAFCLKRESMRHAQKDLQAQLKRVPVLSLPTTPDASCGSPQLSDASPPAGGSKSRLPGAAVDTLSSTFRQNALSFFEEMEDMFKALDAWQKAEAARTEAERSGSVMAATAFPVALDSFLLQSPAQAPTSQVVDYVHQAINQAHRGGSSK